VRIGIFIGIVYRRFVFVQEGEKGVRARSLFGINDQVSKLIMRIISLLTFTFL